MPKSFLRKAAKKIFILLNIIAALLFLAGANVIYFDAEKFWFIGLLTLALPYILFALVFFFFLWAFTFRIWFFISLLAIGVSWRAVVNIFPVHFPPSFSLQKNPNTLRVMNWNVEHFDILEHKTHPETKQSMIDLIKEYQPDVACFQEMVGGDDDAAINYLGDFKRLLGFSEYYYSYENRFNFDRIHHFGIITFSKYPILNKQTISIAPHDYNSTFQYVDLLINSDTIRVFNIHLQSLKFSLTNRQYLDKPTLTDSSVTESKSIIGKLKRGFLKRAIQSNKIREAIEQSPYPVIVCGDFNDVPNSYAYTKIGKGMQDAFVQKGLGFGRTFSGISPTLRIDNIFTDKKFVIDQFTRVAKKLSDHYPLITDVSLTY
jgi:endonuclease/exonuclease/phosphatase family metal-dependent hydrolase